MGERAASCLVAARFGSIMMQDAGTGQGNFITILIAVSALVLTLFLFNPVVLYTGNFMEFESLFHESLLYFLVVSLRSIVVLTAVVFALFRRPPAGRIVVSVLSALAFLAWLQGGIIAWRYGVLDGRDIPWESLVHFGVIDSLIWAAVITTAVIAAAAVKAALVFRFARLLCLALVAVQLAAAVSGWIAMPKDHAFKERPPEGEALFRFSERANVIVIVLDTFQSDIFQEIIEAHPDLKAPFEGFVYFRNALAGSDGTIVSIPNMLTGANYDNSLPYLEFVKKSFLENSLPRTLREYGFSVEFLPILGYTVYRDFSGVAATGRRLRDRAVFEREQALLADLSLFRGAPHFIKSLIYNRQQWLFSGLMTGAEEAVSPPKAADPAGSADVPFAGNSRYAAELANSRKTARRNRDADFINQMLSRSGTARDSGAFRFYHLNGLHLALNMNEHLEYEALEPRRSDMRRQGAGVLKITALFLDRLRQLQVYDNSLIFIVADHGSGVGDAGVNVSALTPGFNQHGPYRGNFKTFKAAGIPLVLVKRPRAGGGLMVSDAPVMLGDIPQTVVAELDLEGRFPGASMFRLKENEARERIYRAFVGPQDRVEYLAPLYEYAVNGHSWEDSSWRETGRVYYARPK